MIQKVYLTIVFIIIGEFVARASSSFQKEYKEQSLNYTSIINNYNHHYNNIFLLGDSYTQGLGINLEQRISFLLNNMDSINILDYSKAGDGWLIYLNKIDKNLSLLRKGDFIIILVNWNDIDFTKDQFNDYFNHLDVKIKKTANNSDSLIHSGEKVDLKRQNSTLRKIIKDVYNNSELIFSLSVNLQNYFKRRGILLPIGEFYYLTKKGYLEKEHQLIKIVNHLNRVGLETEIEIILYLLPEFNLLNNIEYYDQFTSFFERSFNHQSIKVINGVRQFGGSKDDYYSLSIRDGHPNALAHLRISDTLKTIINSSVK